MRLFALATLVLLVSSVPAANAATADEQRATGTTIHLYSLFSGGTASATVRISESVRGSCWTGSLADARPDAYRCFVGNYIYDPCFAPGSGTGSSFVLCPPRPMSTAMRINLTKPLPRNMASGDPTRNPPWMMQLTNGKWCGMTQGATGDIAGMRISYGCEGGAILLGVPNRSSATWTIFAAPSYNAKSYSPVRIASAWW